MMYKKDLTHKMTLRLNDELFEYVGKMSEYYSISPSDFIRQCIALNMDSRKQAEKIIEQLGITASEAVEKKIGGFENGIDRKTNQHNQL